MSHRNQFESFLKSPVLLVLFGWVLLGQSAAEQQNLARVGDSTAVVQDGAVVVQIPVDGVFTKPRIDKLNNPPRLLFDFEGATPASGYSRRSVGKGTVVAVRTALFGNDRSGRPVTRVVLDLTQHSEFTTRSDPGKFLIFFSRSTQEPLKGGSVSSQGAARETAPAGKRPTAIAPALRSVNEIHHMEIKPASERTTVVLDFDHLSRFSVELLERPARLVLAFPETSFGEDWARSGTTDVHSQALTAIRASMSAGNSKVLRLVFDQPSQVTPRIARSGNQLILDFYTADAFARSTANDTAISACQPTPAQTAEAKSLPLPATEVPAKNTPGSRPQTQGIEISAPVVKFENGLLSVSAKNATLTDVLYAISDKTGAQIQLPFANGVLDRVNVDIGPTTPQEVLSTILQGSAYTYYFVESNGALEKVLLVPR